MPFFGFDAISYWWTMLSMSICHIFIAIHLCYFKIGTMFRNFETTQRQQHQYDFSCVLLFGGTMVLFFLFILSVFHLLFHCVYFFHVNISTHFKHIIYIPLLCSRQCKSCVTFLSTLKIWKTNAVGKECGKIKTILRITTSQRVSCFTQLHIQTAPFSESSVRTNVSGFFFIWSNTLIRIRRHVFAWIICITSNCSHFLFNSIKWIGVSVP